MHTILKGLLTFWKKNSRRLLGIFLMRLTAGNWTKSSRTSRIWKSSLWPRAPCIPSTTSLWIVYPDCGVSMWAVTTSSWHDSDIIPEHARHFFGKTARSIALKNFTKIKKRTVHPSRGLNNDYIFRLLFHSHLILITLGPPLGREVIFEILQVLGNYGSEQSVTHACQDITSFSDSPPVFTILNACLLPYGKDSHMV